MILRGGGDRKGCFMNWEGRKRRGHFKREKESRVQE